MLPHGLLLALLTLGMGRVMVVRLVPRRKNCTLRRFGQERKFLSVLVIFFAMLDSSERHSTLSAQKSRYAIPDECPHGHRSSKATL